MTEDKFRFVGHHHHGTIVGRSSNTPWEKAAVHRAHLMRLLPSDQQGRRGTVCIFGMGDGTSLDFRSLLDRFHEVHVVDRNEEAIQNVIRDQNLDDRQRIFHRALNLTGADDVLAARQPLDKAELEVACQRIAQHVHPNAEPFDVVVSNSLIPRLMMPAASLAPENARGIAMLIRAIRHSHVRQLLQHTLPGGQVLLVMDVVSSDTVPILTQSPSHVPAILTAALEQGNFFPGGNPTLVDQVFRECKDQIDRIDATQPWIRETATDHRLSIAFRVIRKSHDDQGNV